VNNPDKVTDRMTQDGWLARHSYLQQVADLQAFVDAAVAEVSIPNSGIPKWNDYLGDFKVGVPLLRSEKVAIDLDPGERILHQLIANLASKSLPGKLADEVRELRSELDCELDSFRRAMAWLLDGNSFTPRHAGLLHYLGWSFLGSYLRTVVGAFKGWRDEEHWLRNYCPMCGFPPAMAQLVGNDSGRFRLLSCGRCYTRWRYRRTSCPFCENEDDRRLGVLAVEGEGGLRIDYCEACGGYLKTYNGEGSEGVLLADWTSLHLDIIACDRGLKRLAASLYRL
jgi:FdhE protein